MGAGYRNDNRTFIKRALLLAGSIIVAGSLAPSPSAVEAGRFELVRESRAGARHPHLIEGKVADVLVRIGGSGSCSGTPITGTRYVVTAAHCVLDHNGDLQVRTVTRGDVTYTAVAVLIDTTYHERQTSQLDAAVLVMDRAVEGPSATVGAALPTSGVVTLAGFQAVDTDGSLLRGSNPHDRPLPSGATGTLIKVRSAAAGCTNDVSSLAVTREHVAMRCGLIPGASGGGLYAEQDGELALVGILSTVSGDLSVNGVVPLSSLQELLQHRDRYVHQLPEIRSARHNGAPMSLS